MAESEIAESAERWLFWPDEPDRSAEPLAPAFGTRTSDEDLGAGASEVSKPSTETPLGSHFSRPVVGDAHEIAEAVLERVAHQIRTSQERLAAAVDGLNRRIDSLTDQVAAMDPEGEFSEARHHLVKVREQLDDLIVTSSAPQDELSGVAPFTSGDPDDALSDQVAAMQARIDAFIERQPSRRPGRTGDSTVDAAELEELRSGVRSLRIRLKPTPQN
jgi:hypothetical protein